MSDYNRIDGPALDRYITGNYGEDQFKQSKPRRKFPIVQCPVCQWSVAIRNGKLALHGRGRRIGGCDGSGMTEPFQVTR